MILQQRQRGHYPVRPGCRCYIGLLFEQAITSRILATSKRRIEADQHAESVAVSPTSDANKVSDLER